MSIKSSEYHVRQRTVLLYIAMGVVLVGLNILLVVQNKSLRAYASRMDQSLELKPGTLLPSMEGLDPQGNKMKLDYGVDPRKTLLLVYSSSCGACQENMPNWEAITRGIDQEAYRVVAVSLSPRGSKEYLSRYDIGSIPVVAEVNPKTRVAYNFTVTPQTILIGLDGRVEKVWTGLLEGAEKRDVENAVGLQARGR